MNQIKLVIIALSFTLSLFSQSIERHVVASNSTSFTAGNGSIEFTLGEVITQTMGSTQNNAALTNGFHQGIISLTKIQELDGTSGLKIFPNPSSELIYVSLKKHAEPITIELLDATGRVLQTNLVSGDLFEIKLTNYAAGIYCLKINHINSYKIVKVN